MNRLKFIQCACVLASAFLLGAAGCGKSPKKIFYINSYHEGYAPSDQKMLAIQQTVAARPNVVLKIFFMDAQRQQSGKSIKNKTDEALKAIGDFNPDVIIASDDDAVKYVIAPYFRKGRVPVVFCGVGWTCQQYGLPTASVTGILEAPPVRETIQTLRKYYPEIKNLIVLGGNSVTERKNLKMLESIFREEGLVSENILVKDFDSWKRFFAAANNKADVVYLTGNGSVPDWSDTEAWEFVYRNIRKPVITCEESLMRYAVFGMAKVEREQGEWAARTALAILDGKQPTDFHVAMNQQTRGFFNPLLAESVGFNPDPELMDKLEIMK
jgi:ABC-type uncharacterized transport system substrate-binding protein